MLRPFTNIAELRQYIIEHSTIFYQAPMDSHPRMVVIKWFTLSNIAGKQQYGQVRLYAPGESRTESLTFTAGLQAHFDRFRVQVTEVR
jgi:hypothetical protein